jgi:hypothetical protein
MAHLDPYAYDVFLSYAHTDDETSPTQSHGWVDVFREELQAAIKKRSGIEAAIWWDSADLRRNQEFTPAIKAAISQSALFLALVSESYLRSRYCRKELTWFCWKTRKERCGLLVDKTDSRLFNVRLYDIPPERWPRLLRKGVLGYPFFTKASKDDLAEPFDLAVLRKPIQRLAQDIIDLLRKMEAPSPPAEPAVRQRPNQRLSVFLADVDGGLVAQQLRLAQKLKTLRIDVLGPTPHAKTAESFIARCHASVHLLNGFSNSSAEAQLALGCRAPKQIVWVPQHVAIPDTGGTPYEEKLAALKHHATAGDNLRFLQGGDSWIEDIVGELEEQRALLDRPAAPQTVFLDASYIDTLLMPDLRELVTYLETHRIQVVITRHYPEHRGGDFPDWAAFVENVRRSKAVVFFFGMTLTDQVQERLDRLFKEIGADHSLGQQIEFIGVYAAPPPEKVPEMLNIARTWSVEWMPNTKAFTPHTLSALVAHFSTPPVA